MHLLIFMNSPFSMKQPRNLIKFMASVEYFILTVKPCFPIASVYFSLVFLCMLPGHNSKYYLLPRSLVNFKEYSLCQSMLAVHITKHDINMQQYKLALMHDIICARNLESREDKG